MTARELRPAGLLLLIVSVAAACGPSEPSATRSATAPAVATTAPLESDGPVETLPPPTVGPPLEGQTDTEWGRIWDTLPTGFPKYPGAVLSEEASTGPASAAYVVEGGEPAAIATWFQQAYETAGYSTDALSGPLEDGSYVLDSSGDDPACRLSVTIAPLGGTTTLTVMYGAACPHD